MIPPPIADGAALITTGAREAGPKRSTAMPAGKASRAGFISVIIFPVPTIADAAAGVRSEVTSLCPPIWRTVAPLQKALPSVVAEAGVWRVSCEESKVVDYLQMDEEPIRLAVLEVSGLVMADVDVDTGDGDWRKFLIRLGDGEPNCPGNEARVVAPSPQVIGSRALPPSRVFLHIAN